MRRLSRVVAAVASVAVMSTSAGCGGDNPSPSVAPTPEGDASSQPAATPEAPTPPPEVRKKSAAGATAATRLFLEALNYAGRTGDTRPMRSAYVQFCTRCEAIADGIDTTYERGGEIRGGDWLPRRFKFYSIQANVAYVDAVVDYSEQTWQESANAVAQEIPAKRDVLKAFNLRWSATSGWSVSALDPQA